MIQNCNPKKCSCEDKGLHNPCLICNPVECPEPNPCPEVFQAQCIIYNGPGSECIGITPDTDVPVQQIIDTLLVALEPILCLHCTTATYPIDGSIEIPLSPIIAWDAVPAADGYAVSFGTPSPIFIENTTNLFYVPGELDPGTHYEWTIVPYNDSGISIKCDGFEFTTAVETCINPINILIATLGIKPEMNEEVLISIIEIWGEKGSFAISSCGVCCPDCHPYMLGQTQMVTALLNCLRPKTPCCANIATGNIQPDTLDMINLYGLQCCNDFTSCVQQIAGNVDNFGQIFNQGIFEFSTINNNTTLCVLIETLIHMGFTESQMGTIIMSLMSAGMVITCESNGIMTISSLQVYYDLHCTLPGK